MARFTSKPSKKIITNNQSSEDLLSSMKETILNRIAFLQQELSLEDLDNKYEDCYKDELKFLYSLVGFKFEKDQLVIHIVYEEHHDEKHIVAFTVAMVEDIFPIDNLISLRGFENLVNIDNVIHYSVEELENLTQAI